MRFTQDGKRMAVVETSPVGKSKGRLLQSRTIKDIPKRMVRFVKKKKKKKKKIKKKTQSIERTVSFIDLLLR